MDRRVIARYTTKFGKRTVWRLTRCGWLMAMLLLVAMVAPDACGQESPPSDQPQNATGSTPADPQSWDLHFQSTVVGQGHPSFPAEYTGLNSLTTGASVRETISVDVTSGVRLWRGGEFFGDVLMWQGYGLEQLARPRRVSECRGISSRQDIPGFLPLPRLYSRDDRLRWGKGSCR
jgi:hypothetical protein